MAGLSPTIGKIDGIPIELHWTFILLLLFILFLNFYDFLLWVLLFVCVLIHELVHSINSKRNDIKVKKIVLYPFGGGSIIDFEKVKPEIEFRISLVGPIASLLIAVGFGIATILTPAGIIKSTLQLLFLLNVFLGIFNLLPWLPLDGGRALRSYLQKKRSFFDATKIAVMSSNIVTVLFIIGTFIYAALLPNSLFYKEFVVLIDVAIAFFIYSGAQVELQSAYIRENISDLKAVDAITKNYVLMNNKNSIRDLYKNIMDKQMHIVIFKNDDKFQILSNSSFQKLLRSRGKILPKDFMVDIPSIPYNLSLYNALERMRSEDSGIAAVVKAKRLVGILLMQHAESIIALHISQKKQWVK